MRGEEASVINGQRRVKEKRPDAVRWDVVGVDKGDEEKGKEETWMERCERDTLAGGAKDFHTTLV
jgi:hypothetical protein